MEDCEIADHDHETRWEWNRVISRNGTFIIVNKAVTIGAGQGFVTPPGIRRTVSTSKDDDLSLLAVFVPTLV